MHYELFSVLMHSGGALAGHYYAFIRDFSRGAWFKFNASHVSAVGDAELAAAAGSEDGRASGYMLMYRRVRADNPRGVADDAVPADVKAHVGATCEGEGGGPSAARSARHAARSTARLPEAGGDAPNAKAPTCVISADDGIRVTATAWWWTTTATIWARLSTMNAEAEEGGADATAPTADGGDAPPRRRRRRRRRRHRTAAAAAAAAARAVAVAVARARAGARPAPAPAPAPKRPAERGITIGRPRP